MAVSRAIGIYVTGLFLLVLAVVLLVVPSLHVDDWLLVLILLGVQLAAQRSIVKFTSIGTFSFTLSAVSLIAPLLGGVAPSVTATLLATVAYGLVKRRAWWRNLFHIGQNVLSVFLAGTVYLMLGGQVGAAFGHPLEALSAGLAMIIFSILNISLYVALQTNRPYGRALVTSLRWRSLYMPASVLMATVVMRVLAQGGLVWTLLVVLCFAFLERASNRLSAINSASEQHANRMAAVLNATKSAIITVEGDVIRLANEQFAKLIGLDAQMLAGIPLDRLPSTPLTRALASERSACAEASQSKVLALEGEERLSYDWYRGPIIGRDGTIQGAIEVLTDVTNERRAEENLRLVHHAMLRALTAAVDARDTYTHGHSSRVAHYATILTRELGLGEEVVERIGYAAMLHDIGKLGVDDRVLRKHGPLTPNERAIMMTHPVIGAQVLEKAGVFTELIPGVRWHHEWVNGGGYPDGLKGDQIPLDARIICVADAFDAMTSDRPYRRALPSTEALARLRSGKGVQFDTGVVVAFEEVFQRGDIVLAEQSRPEGEPEQVLDEVTEGTIRPVHGKELEIVYRVSKENYARLNVAAVLRRFLEIFYDSIGHNIYMILLTDELTDELVLHSSLGHAQDLGTVRVQQGDGIVGKAAATGRPVVVPYVDRSERYIALIPDTRSEIAVPLLFNNQVIGVLNVESAVPNAFTKDDLYLFEALAQQVASALELARYHERVAFAATHDGLTGVLNHNHFYERLTDEVQRAKRYAHDVSLAIVDVDGLKAINDTYGHVAGDVALREYAQFLRSEMRDVDIVARYGGDEFAVILPETGAREARTAVERLLGSLNGRYFQVGDQRIPLPTASFGIASYPTDGERATELVAVADKMMYENKPPSGNGRRSITGGST